jgi:hypothetical protein
MQLTPSLTPSPSIPLQVLLILALQQPIHAVYEQAMDLTSHDMLILRLIANLEPTSNLNLRSIKPIIISDKHVDKKIKCITSLVHTIKNLPAEIHQHI